MKNIISFLTVMLVTASLFAQNVGIGTTTPETKLHIVGEDNNGTAATLKLTSSNGTQNMLLDGNEIDGIDSLGLYLQNNVSFPLVLAQGGGNVGIGFTMPTDKLHVNGNIRLADGKLLLTSSISNEMVIINGNTWAHSDGNQIFGTGGDHFIMASREGSGESAGVYGDGNNLAFWSPGDAAPGQPTALAYFLDEDLFDAADTDPYNNNALKAYLNTSGMWQVSDQSKKQNIQPMDHALEKVLQLGGYTYEFAPNEKERAKGDKPLPAAGIMAQDLKQVLPQAVNENAQGDYFVNYSAIVPLLIEAIKDQQAEIEALKDQVQVLQDK